MMIRLDVRFWLAAAILGAVCAGCASTESAAERPNVSAPRFGQTTVQPPASSAPVQLEGNTAIDSETTPSTHHETAQLPSPPPVTDKKVETSSDTKPANKQEITAEEEQYNTAKPALMGIRLTDTLNAVLERFEEPLASFEMEDELAPLSIYEYEGFTVGFNPRGTVEFVEITSEAVNPGLGGLKLGQTVEDAETALGVPDANTQYALQYKADGTILKLDVDPKNKTIQSIKLFADTTA